ncbi:hypothetical protein VM98_36220, partial [Streptomyces rubellomurinus subsp. indigoferus]
WSTVSTMTGRLGEADRSRMRPSGVLPVSAADRLALSDAALAQDRPPVLPVRLDLPALPAAEQAHVRPQLGGDRVAGVVGYGGPGAGATGGGFL